MTNLEYVKDLVERQFDVQTTEVVDSHQISFVVAKDDVHRLLSTLKQEGWKQLSYLSAVDWPDDSEFELVYILMNWDRPLYIQVRTRIDRDNPVIDSILPIYPGAKYYERECYEFFGVAFPGNPDHKKQLILEEWDDIPPLRKDFDPRAYSDAHFPKRNYPDKHTEMKGKQSEQATRAKRKNRIAAVGKGGRD